MGEGDSVGETESDGEVFSVSLKELLSEMQRKYFGELKKYALDGEYRGALTQSALSFAVGSLNAAFGDLKFNANFSSLLYDFLLRVASVNKSE